MKYLYAAGRVNVSDTRGSGGGFLVVYADMARYSIYDCVGHDDLLSDIAAMRSEARSRILSDGIRLFFVYVSEGVLLSGVRQIDDDRISSDPAGYARIIRKVLK